MNSNQFFKLVSLALVVLFAACQNQTSETTDTPESANETEVTLELSSFVDSSGTFDIITDNGNTLIGSTHDNQWLSYNIEVPTAGRYQVIASVASSEEEPGALWIEDYINNKDGRTYNITGNMPVVSTGDKQTTKEIAIDGSPLNKGMHPIKLHFRGGNVYVHSVKMVLMKEHQVTPTTLTQSTDGDEWEVVWSDEFDGEGLVDESKWTYDIGNWGWGNNELQYYTEKRLENARQEDGNLIIEARKNDDGNLWTSARLTTRGKVSFLYGKIEFRAKVPRERGNWAAAWTLGDDYVDEISWPYCGEIDILESVGYEVNDETGDGIAHATVHTPAYYFKINNQISSTKEVKNIAGEFHTYSVEWTPTEVKGFVDGEEYYMYDKTANEMEWPFNKAQNIIINLAMGGGWGGVQGMDETVTSQKYILDYVRVYERK